MQTETNPKYLRIMINFPSLPEQKITLCIHPQRATLSWRQTGSYHIRPALLKLGSESKSDNL